MCSVQRPAYRGWKEGHSTDDYYKHYKLAVDCEATALLMSMILPDT